MPFGDKWMKQRIPKLMLDNWQDKREAALNAGEPERPLIDYADFTDYKSIVERGDNWREAFKRMFVNRFSAFSPCVSRRCMRAS
jgi:hypothetical protein